MPNVFPDDILRRLRELEKKVGIGATEDVDIPFFAGTATDAQILIYQVPPGPTPPPAWAAVTVSGDATINDTGVVTVTGGTNYWKVASSTLQVNTATTPAYTKIELDASADVSLFPRTFCYINPGSFFQVDAATGISLNTSSGTIDFTGVMNVASMLHANGGITLAGSTIASPIVDTMSAASSTIATTSLVRQLNNTSGGALTLTSAPTIANGIDGQMLVIFNGSANDVVLQDQGTLAASNLRLGATTRTLGTRDSLKLLYSTTVGDWIEVAFSNVV